MNRRTGVLVGLGALAAGGAAAAAVVLRSSSSLDAPDGAWTRRQTGDLLIAVPDDWTETRPDSPVWTAGWSAPNGDGTLLVAPALGAQDAQSALITGLNALRAVSRGFTLTSAPEAVGDGTTTLIRQSYEVTWPAAGTGTLWSVASGPVTGLVLLSGAAVTEDMRRTVGAWIEVDAEAAAAPAPSAQGEWMAVTAGGVSLQVPSSWSDTGAVAGSQRWTATWALVDESDTATARILVAPSMPEGSVVDAMAQIEADAAAGAVPGFTATTRTAVELTGLDEAVRVDFTAGPRGDDEGCLWVFSGSDTVAAVQYVTTGAIETSIRDGVEQSLRLG